MMLSFIIPAKNEERYLGRCLDSIRRHCPKDISHEVILVDNGSTDRTLSIARENGVDSILHCTGKIGACRNAGAESAVGEFMIFLDADVLLTESWARGIGSELTLMRESLVPMISGSWYRTTRESLIERDWFEPMAIGEKTHMNGGHLVIASDHLRLLGGFSETLETGEDYEFCDRAKRQGFTVRNNQSLSVIHLGYPSELRSFFWREVWHGRGDYHSPRTFLRSPTAVGSLGATVLAVVLLSLAIIWKSSMFVALAAAAVLVPATVVIFRTFGTLGSRHVPGQMCVAAAYVLARGVAGIPGMTALAKRFRKK